MVLLPCSKCCGPCWRCYTDGTDYECVGPDDTPKDGWTPVGDCHATEEECAENCPPLPCDDSCNSPFQTAGYIAREKAIDWKNSGGIVGDVFPGGPTLTGSIQSTEGVVTFENFSNGFVMDGQQATNITGRDVVFGLSVSGNLFPEFSLECLPAQTSTSIDYAPMKDPANRVLIETQSYSPAFLQPEGTSGIIEISTGMANVIGVDSDKRVLLRSCSFGGVTYTNNIDAALPSTFAPIIRFVHKPWCAAEIPSGIGLGETFYIPHTEWSGKVSIEFDVVKSNDIDDIIVSYNFDWLWEDAFQQPSCAASCGPNLCCIPPITINGLYQCKNITKSECDSLGGDYYKGYKSDFCNEGSSTVDPICGSGLLCQDQSLCYEVVGGPASCVEYTVTIESIEKELTECALSFMLGTGFGNGYPLSEGLNPPCGQKIPGFTPTFRWVNNSVTVRDGEIGYLVAEIDIEELNSLNSHQNILFPDNPAPPTPGSPAYSGGMSCKIVQEFPFFVKGCEISKAEIIIGSPLPPRCELPSSVYQLEGRRGADLFVLASNEFVSGLSELDTQGRVVLPECGCDESCSSIPIEVKYTFRSNEFGYETVKWWPTNSPRPQENSYLGTSWIVESDQEWTISLTQKTIECESNKKAVTTGGRTMPIKTTGPGTHLAKTLASWGFKEGKGCSCKKMSRLMDGWGSACATEPHLTTIVDHLEKEAKKRKLPFVRKLAEALIKRAVRQSENQS